MINEEIRVMEEELKKYYMEWLRYLGPDAKYEDWLFGRYHGFARCFALVLRARGINAEEYCERLCREAQGLPTK